MLNMAKQQRRTDMLLQIVIVPVIFSHMSSNSPAALAIWKRQVSGLRDEEFPGSVCLKPLHSDSTPLCAILEVRQLPHRNATPQLFLNKSRDLSASHPETAFCVYLFFCCNIFFWDPQRFMVLLHVFIVLNICLRDPQRFVVLLHVFICFIFFSPTPKDLWSCSMCLSVVRHIKEDKQQQRFVVLLHVSILFFKIYFFLRNPQRFVILLHVFIYLFNMALSDPQRCGIAPCDIYK